MDGHLELRLEPTIGDIPAFVKETLHGGGDSICCSVSLAPNNWLWLVANRALHVWRFGANSSVFAHRFSLPTTGLHNSARLVAVYVKGCEHNRREYENRPAILAVTPEGAIRHWTSPNCPHTDSNANIGGQVASDLQQVNQMKFLLSTTTGSFYLLSIVYESPKRAMVSVSSLLPSESMVGGLGRRMTSLFFSPSLNDDTRLTTAVLINHSELLVATTKALQLWSLTDRRLIWASDSTQLVAGRFMSIVWNLTSSDEQVRFGSSLKIWLISAVPYRSGALILTAAVNHIVGVNVHFALGFINSLNNSPDKLDWFNIINFPEQFRISEEESFLNLRLLCPSEWREKTVKLSEGVFILSSQTGTFVRLPSSLLAHGVTCTIHSVRFEQELLGAGCDCSSCYVFLRDSGLILLRLLPKNFDASGINVSQMLQLPLPSSSSESSCDEENGRETLFKTAFLHYVHKNMSKAGACVDELLREKGDLGILASDLSRKVVRESEIAGVLLRDYADSVVDDYPASDPRWTEAKTVSQSQLSDNEHKTLGNSLLIQYQLEDKRKTLALVESFLRTMDLRTHMQAGSSSSVLSEHRDKLFCCLSLHSTCGPVPSRCLSDSFRTALERRRESVSKSLTLEDVFFRRVSAFDSLLPGLLDYLLHSLADSRAKEQRLAIVEEVGKLLVLIVRAIGKSRSLENIMVKVHWTSDENILRHFRNYLHSCVDTIRSLDLSCPSRELLLDYAYELTDFVLSEQSVSVDSSSSIVELHEIGRDPHRSLELAEKHGDFHALICLADRLADTDRQLRLDEWKARFADRDFATFLHQYYLDNGLKERLLREPGVDVDLFLEAYPRLSWIRDVRNGHFHKASRTLSNLALRQTSSATKKKTLYSLAKLCSLASDQPDLTLIAETDEHLKLIENQLLIPGHILDSAGYSDSQPDLVPPLETGKVVSLSLSDLMADESTFVRLLDLIWPMIATADQSDAHRLKMDIWFAALKADDWTVIVNVEESKTAARNSCYFRTMFKLMTVEGVLIIGPHYTQCCMSEYSSDQKLALLPDLDNLLAVGTELGSLVENATFQYLIKAGNEWARREFDTNDNVP